MLSVKDNVAPATARRASHEVASNPLSPTKFEKPAQRAGFFAFVAHEDENLRGRGGSTRRRPDKTRQRRIRLQLPEKAIMPYPVYSAGET